MKKVLVTGAKGQLGHKIRQMFEVGTSDLGLGTWVDSQNPKPESQNLNPHLILTDADTMDITDKLQVHKVIKSERPDFIIHGAAYTAVDKAEDNVDLCRQVNALGTKNIAETAKEFNIPLIYISTDYVFDGKKKSPYLETDEAHPLSIYGQTKFEGENFIRETCDKYYIIRSAWIFGELPEGHTGTNFVETMLRLAQEKDSLNIVNDQIGSPTYTGDLVEIIKKLCTENCVLRTVSYGTYHFSGTGECSWYNFAQEIFKQENITIKLNPITSDQYPQKAKRPNYSYMDKSKIETVLDIKVRPWQKMLAEYLGNR